MKKNNAIWKLFTGYILILLLMLISNSVSGQSPCGDNLCVVQFNAGWNAAKSVDWVTNEKLTDCSTKFIDIAVDTKSAGTYKIVVVPTILIFNGGEEVGRFQANIMMEMEATQKEVQEKIDEIIMEDF
tara:strand:- start:136 stop:519 length:384 start_codon:yes stop_codon:yes gene_type:complete